MKLTKIHSVQQVFRWNLRHSGPLGIANLSNKEGLQPYITHLFNFIVTTSTFPSKWKHAKIIPVPKNNSEFRPIAILPFLSKVLERMLHKQINNYVHANNLLFDKQSGFRSKHSCITALVEVSENLRTDIDDSKTNFLVLLDHSKAFDTIDHNTLCLKLKRLFNFFRVQYWDLCFFLYM